MCKVYFKNKLICFTSQAPEPPFEDGFLAIKISNEAEIQLVFQNLKMSANINKIMVFNPEGIENYFNIFKTLLTVEEAAGGIIRNKKNELLFIFRNAHWDLPKGHIEKGETEAETAKREVEEECGIRNLQIGDKIDYTYHIFQRGDEFVLKQTAWFAMEVDSFEELKPQTEEGIVKAVWKTDDEITKDFPQTFPSIVELIKVYRRAE